MFKTVLNQLHTALLLLFVMIVLTGVLYPLMVTGIAQGVFHEKANGSLIIIQNRIVGSRYIGQWFNAPQYFWGRPSVTASVPYNGLASGGSTVGLSHPEYVRRVAERFNELKAQTSPRFPQVPMDLLLASGSGLDPEISPAAALFQIPRIAKARHVPEFELEALVMDHLTPRTFGFLGEPRVNVLQLNVLLDEFIGLKHAQ